MSPQSIGGMSMWHFMAFIEGHGRAHWGWKAPVEAMSVDKLRALGVEGFEDVE
ncbi:MAG: hypothetical protein Q4G24_10630 [Paracoccus sp. (in: a-proteobacteria)]|uniref:hypothetical protein n=1 Tax=Paracoccus sp. TaxID=267 RepID=UPI0026DF5541|nr:hypothetical protein [Paracoccus sp. (in: a-proteobacteria)]MDO5621913.1 hypothetical protein [Paracoccus sp. (in: a-proteobacteria)]